MQSLLLQRGQQHGAGNPLAASGCHVEASALKSFVWDHIQAKP